MALHSISAHSLLWRSLLAGKRRYAEIASDPMPDNGDRGLGSQLSRQSSSHCLLSSQESRPFPFQLGPTIRPYALLTVSILLLISPETLHYLREIHHMLKDELHVWLSATLILLKNQRFVIASTTVVLGSQNTLAIPALWHSER